MPRISHTEKDLRVRLRKSIDREAALLDAIRKAIDAVDDMGRTPYQRETRTAAILEKAIGRTPREPVPDLDPIFGT